LSLGSKVIPPGDEAPEEFTQKPSVSLAPDELK